MPYSLFMLLFLEKLNIILEFDGLFLKSFEGFMQMMNLSFFGSTDLETKMPKMLREKNATNRNTNFWINMILLSTINSLS